MLWYVCFIQYLGLLTSDGQIVDYKETLLAIHKRYGKLERTVEFCSRLEVPANVDRSVWATDVQVNAPTIVCVSAKGVTKEDAEQTAAALMIVKLRVS